MRAELRGRRTKQNDASMVLGNAPFYTVGRQPSGRARHADATAMLEDQSIVWLPAKIEFRTGACAEDCTLGTAVHALSTSRGRHAGARFTPPLLLLVHAPMGLQADCTCVGCSGASFNGKSNFRPDGIWFASKWTEWCTVVVAAKLNVQASITK